MVSVKKYTLIAIHSLLNLWFVTLLVWWFIRKSGFIPYVGWVDSFRAIVALIGGWADICFILIGVIGIFINVSIKNKIWYWVILVLVVALSVLLGNTLMEA